MDYQPQILWQQISNQHDSTTNLDSQGWINGQESGYEADDECSSDTESERGSESDFGARCNREPGNTRRMRVGSRGSIDPSCKSSSNSGALSSSTAINDHSQCHVKHSGSIRPSSDISYQQWKRWSEETDILMTGQFTFISNIDPTLVDIVSVMAGVGF